MADAVIEVPPSVPHLLSAQVTPLTPNKLPACHLFNLDHGRTLVSSEALERGEAALTRRWDEWVGSISIR
jgi:hypothetical protein